MRKRMILMFSLMVMAALTLSACDGMISEAGQPAEVQNAGVLVDATPTPQGDPVAPGDSAPVGEAPPPDQGEAASDEQPAASLPSRPELGFELGHAELVATNPNGVSLDSGRLQLVEMFAFW